LFDIARNLNCSDAHGRRHSLRRNCWPKVGDDDDSDESSVFCFNSTDTKVDVTNGSEIIGKSHLSIKVISCSFLRLMETVMQSVSVLPRWEEQHDADVEPSVGSVVVAQLQMMLMSNDQRV
jgi:hypothetical protein